MHNDILRSIDNGGGVILVLLDMSAAFDTVNHKLLLSRLSTCYGLCGSYSLRSVSNGDLVEPSSKMRT